MIEDALYFICRACGREKEIPTGETLPLCDHCNSLVCRECLKTNKNPCGHRGGHALTQIALAQSSTRREPLWIEMPLVRACVEKWNKGRTDHGPVFVGDPLPDLFAELIDAINYANQGQIEGEDLSFIEADLIDMAREVRDRYWKRHAAFVKPDLKPEVHRVASV